VSDVDSVPSDLGDNQWAEINAYDFEKFQAEKRKQKADAILQRE